MVTSIAITNEAVGGVRIYNDDNGKIIATILILFIKMNIKEMINVAKMLVLLAKKCEVFVTFVTE